MHGRAKWLWVVLLTVFLFCLGVDLHTGSRRIVFSALLVDMVGQDFFSKFAICDRRIRQIRPNPVVDLSLFFRAIRVHDYDVSMHYTPRLPFDYVHHKFWLFFQRGLGASLLRDVLTLL